MTYIVAHRGACYFAPENTLAAFRKAIEIGADGIETDVQLTEDRKMVIHHNYSVDGTANATGKIADMLRAGILEEIPHADCQIYDINAHDMAFLQGLLNRSDAFGIGSPTINADAVAPVWNLLSHVDAINNRKRPVLVFGSYGWSGEAVPNLIARLKGLKSDVFEEGFRTIFVPSEEELQKAKEFGKQFARSLAK